MKTMNSFILLIFLCCSAINIYAQSTSDVTLKDIIKQMQTLSDSHDGSPLTVQASQFDRMGFGSIEGKIFYSDYLGKKLPVADALVRIFPVTRFFVDHLSEMDMNASLDFPEYPPVRTSDNGFFSIKSIPEGRYYIIAFRQGFKTAMTVINVQNNQDKQANLMLYPLDNSQTGSLFGKVVEQISNNGSNQFNRYFPVQQIEIQLFQIKPETVELIRSVMSNNQGRFYFADVPSGDYLLKIKHKDYQLFRKTIVISPDAHNAFPIIKPVEGDFDETVFSQKYSDKPSDTSFHGELIQYINRMGEGCFCIGPYGNWHPDVNFVHAVLKRDIPAPATRLTGNVYHMEIKGKLATAYPLSDIHILVRPFFPYPSLMTFPEFYAVTDKKGQFSCDKLPSDYHVNGLLMFEVRIQSKGFEPLKQQIILSPGTDNSRNFHLNAYGTLCNFKGHIMTSHKTGTSSQKPIAKAAIQLIHFQPDTQKSTRQWMILSKSDGTFECKDIPPGTYKINIHASGYDPLEINETISPGSTMNKNYFLSAYIGPARLAGKVLNGAVQCQNDEKCEQVIIGAKVILKSIQLASQEQPPHQWYEVKTNDQGIYEFLDIQPGHYQMNVSIERFQPWGGLIKIVRETEHAKNIELNPIVESANLTGYIMVNKSDCHHHKNCQKPIKNARVVLSQRHSSGTTIPIRTQTSDDGSFRFETIPAMSYLVNIKAQGYDPQIREMKLLPGSNEITYILKPALECQNNTECVENYYCAKTRGHCERRGVCLKLPDICPSVLTPICGCDGISYNNFCVAAMSGVSIAYHGACVPAGMTGQLSGKVFLKHPEKKEQLVDHAEITLRRKLSDTRTAPPEFKTKTSETGEYSFERLPSGEYQLIAEGPNLISQSIDIIIPDNQSLSKNIFLSGIVMDAIFQGVVKQNCQSKNCHPHVSGATVRLTHLLFDSVGNLSQDAIRSSQTDAQGAFTFYDLASGEYRVTVQADGFMDWEDGFILKGKQTKNLNIKIHPIKSCFDNSTCLPIQYCEKPHKSCNQPGVCQSRPITCMMLFDPVCGCDGRTYNNACEAALAGVNVAFRGRCIQDQ
ncbi:secreted protein containing Proteinase inhibitor I1, Kazal domain protein [Candidatus Magnetomorum sp. HK-1]|nr:secreted protein containing Proteinase inhibitor I1, Kazal domain protein [Candidatus Magnetomorum sp. HK-1]